MYLVKYSDGKDVFEKVLSEVELLQKWGNKKLDFISIKPIEK